MFVSRKKKSRKKFSSDENIVSMRRKKNAKNVLEGGFDYDVTTRVVLTGHLMEEKAPVKVSISSRLRM